MSAVLRDVHVPVPLSPPASLKAHDFIYAVGSSLLAISLACLALFGTPLAQWTPSALLDRARGALSGLRALHSGHTGDYVAWLTFGVAALGGLFLLALQ